MNEDIRCYRPLIIGRRGAVAANHPLAAQAGLMALRAGGNAVDAAAATALALSVVEPMMSGLGGDAFLADGSAPPVGHPIVQPDLADTLEEIAAEGADCLYRGALARRLAAGCAEAGAFVAETDLAEFHAEIQPPLAIDYRGLTVLEAPPNSTGFVLLQELKTVEHFDLKAMGLGSADLVHVLVEAKKLAFADRERWGADPRTLEEVHGDPPFAELLSADYAARLAARINR